MHDYMDIFEHIHAHPGMYTCGTYLEVTTLLAGFDLGRSGGVFHGFREWLLPRVGCGNNVSWERLVLLLVFPDNPGCHAPSSLPAAEQELAIDKLFGLIRAFTAERDDVRRGGLGRIYRDYELWLSHTAVASGEG